MLKGRRDGATRLLATQPAVAVKFASKLALPSVLRTEQVLRAPHPYQTEKAPNGAAGRATGRRRWRLLVTQPVPLFLIFGLLFFASFGGSFF